MNNRSSLIPVRFRDQIAAMPECSYGVTRIVVTLDDGSRISDVFVAWSEEIVKVGTSLTVTFDPDRIVKVEIQ